MLNNMNFLSIFFRLFNFTVTFCIFAYIFKNYLLDNIKKQIKDRMQYLKDLKDEQINFNQKIIQTDKEIIDQDKLTKELLSKLDKWNNNIENQQIRRLKEFEDIKGIIENKQLIRNNILSKMFTYKLIVPKIIQNNKTEILNDFENQDRVIDYQKQIIKFIKKNT